MRIESATDFERLIWPGDPEPAHEGLTLEFKAKVDEPREAAIDVAAMANTDGGTLIFGVEEGHGPNGYKVATGIVAIDVDKTKECVANAIDRWLSATEQQPEMYPLALRMGVSVLLVVVRPSARLVAVRADSPKREGLVYVGRNSHGKVFMGADEVEHRMQGYAPRAMRIRLQAFLDSSHAGHKPGERIETLLYFSNRQKWPEKASLATLGPFSATVLVGLNSRTLQPVDIPYEMISSAWWQAEAQVPAPGRPALHLRGNLAHGEGAIVLIPA